MKWRSVLLAALLGLAAPWASAAAPVVSGEAALAPKAAPAAKLRMAPPRHVQLPSIAEAAVEKVREANRRSAEQRGTKQLPQRLFIGVVRALDREPAAPTAGDLAWVPVPGGWAAQVSLTSPRAESMRLAIDLAGTPEDIEMVFFGSADPARLEGPVRVADVRDRTTPWWSPLTEGETQTVEFFAPARHDPRAIALRVTRASHILTTPSSNFTKRMADIGASGTCNVDVPCSRLASNGAFRNTAGSVAQMVFADAGFMALCTGTLLNDSDPSSQIPYFFGANHCFENDSPPYKTREQMQVVANSLATLWGFEANACNSRTPRGDWSQLNGGATLLYNNVTADALLLRLNDTPPAGSFYSGWDANTVPVGTSALTIHHPQGDLKKVSEGNVRGFTAPNVGGGSIAYIDVQWSSGTTEGGSSGAGLWTHNGAEFLFRGGLWGGTALCTNPAGSDYYSRFDLVYPDIARYLSPSGSPLDYTDLWWNPNESGWGLNLIQHPSRIIFGVWYTYGADGKQTWFVIPTGQWTSSNTYTGPVYATAGPHYVGSFDASKVVRMAVGSATLTFSDANNGTFAYSVNGVSGTKSITRQPF